MHEGSLHGRVSKMFSEEGFGFLETRDGREIYFHEHSVLDSGFTALKIGTEVHFVRKRGKGPQASPVIPVKHHDMMR